MTNASIVPLVRIITDNPQIGNGVVLSMPKAPGGYDRQDHYQHYGLLPQEAVSLGKQLTEAGEAVMLYVAQQQEKEKK